MESQGGGEVIPDLNHSDSFGGWHSENPNTLEMIIDLWTFKPFKIKKQIEGYFEIKCPILIRKHKNTLYNVTVNNCHF